ncbi:CaiF/GrlA family transcriptional regulator [Serratia marcescens]|nr:CaiF/GrlA family transcriptional regulator [Serratia marcescens]MBH3234670.1 CaiF/GrlA family transcriptional regulator [Serratia marcescens]
MKQSNTDNRRLRIKESNDILKQRVRVKARQRNHESYCLPTILSHLPPMPLYMAVAHYALLKRVPVSRQTISVEFRISTRRALEVMRYLFNAKDGVMCTRLPPLPGASEQGHRIQVHAISSRMGLPGNEGGSVFNPISSETAHMHKDRIDNPLSPYERGHTYQDMRRWFLQRQNVE